VEHKTCDSILPAQMGEGCGRFTPPGPANRRWNHPVRLQKKNGHEDSPGFTKPSSLHGRIGQETNVALPGFLPEMETPLPQEVGPVNSILTLMPISSVGSGQREKEGEAETY